MQRVTSIFGVLVMLLFSASPVLACMLPEQQMTAEEQSCCKKMAGNCADMSESSSDMDMSGSYEAMVMPESAPAQTHTKDHSCCRKTTPVVQSAALTGNATNHIQIHLLSFATAATPSTFASQGFALAWQLRVNSPPPPAVSVTVLRV